MVLKICPPASDKSKLLAENFSRTHLLITQVYLCMFSLLELIQSCINCETPKLQMVLGGKLLQEYLVNTGVP